MAYIDDLFKRYLDNTCTEEELHTLLRYFEHEAHTREGEEWVQKELFTTEAKSDLSPELEHIVSRNRAAIYSIRGAESAHLGNRSKVMIRWMAIAASILLIWGITLFFLNMPTTAPIVAELQDIAPGTNRATLSLSDGRSVELNDNQGGLVANEEGLAYSDGTLILGTAAAEVATITTPRAGQYQITLPDGSRVWLNAASTLRYPTHFTGDVRRVELQGEAYFEIRKKQAKEGHLASEQKMPFIVATTGQEITVLGTQFNVMAYAEEPATQTTLVEGKVRLASSGGKAMELLPGAQAVLSKDGWQVQKVNVENYTAWKDGVIVMESQTLGQVFRQLERWYDVEFVVDKGVRLPGKTLSGDVLRDLPLSALLQTLEEQTGLRFERKERRVVVKSN